MKKYKYLSYVFTVLAVLLSNVMCATVAYCYCEMQWGIRYGGYSAPASVAFLYVIPYGIGIAACAALAFVFCRRHRSRQKCAGGLK